LLRKYDWPGNVRQLFAALESAAISAGGGKIQAQHLPEAVRGAEQTASARYRSSGPLEDERQAIEDAIAHAGGSLSRAAELLGMGRTTLWRKLRAHGLSADGVDEASLAERGDGGETNT
jgi:transcriptional regulator of acetoin/glycerol metabolism